MDSLDFPGRERLIQAFDGAVAQSDPQAVTASLRRALCQLMSDPRTQLPGGVLEPVSGYYARRELYRSKRYGYSVVAMTWGPGQGTPIHDHAGLWCVEGVWHGQVEIVQYELVEQFDERFRFQPIDSMQAGAGPAGCLIPPHEYHTIRNPSDSTTAVSLHIYQAAMTCCSVFRPLGEDWYVRGMRDLQLDKAH